MLELGTSYYPELVDPQEWARDLGLMKQAGLSVIRMLDFAWTAIEPREGVYTFEWLDRFLALAGEEGFRVVLCTPTATPPPWLGRQYPEILVELRRGERRPMGGRRDVCVNSVIYRHFADDLARRLGQRYGRHEAVIGWQIDNELMGPEGIYAECHCPECTWRFRQWLKARYETVEEVNRAWGLTFWNQAVSDWGEIITPRNRRAAQGHVLDYARFFSDSQLEFLRIQYDALRATADERQFVTHNSTGVFNRGINHIAFHRSLDVAAWDCYQGSAGQPLPLTYACLAHDLMRSARHEPFLVLETSGARGVYPAFLAEQRAHGARMIVFWHWRRHRANQESGPNALCDYAGRPVPGRLEEVRRFRDRIAFDASLPAELPPRRAAIMLSYDTARFEIRKRPEPVPYLESLVKLYHPFWQRGCAMDVVEPGDDLLGYRLVVAPSVELMSEEQAATIRDFVAGGGVFFACAPTAHRSLSGTRYPIPGELLRNMCGCRWLDARVDGVTAADLDGGEVPVERSAEPLEAESAEVLARFAGGPADGRPAVTANAFGKGRAFYQACVSHPLAGAVATRVLEAADIPFTDHPHESASVLPHLAGRGMWYFNHGDEPVEIAGHTIPPRDFLFVLPDGTREA